MRRRNYLITVFEFDTTGPVAPPFERYADLFTEDSGVRYATWQVEHCPSTERDHVQMYIEFSSPTTLDAARDAIGSASLHAEPRRGSREQARDYCRKDESRVCGPWEFGVYSSAGQGRRTDIHRVANSILHEGRNIPDVACDFPCEYIKYSMGIHRLRFVHLQRTNPSWREVFVRVLWGPPGSGKSRRAMEHAPGDCFVLDPGSSLWFDGYDGQGTLILDDFVGWIRIHTLLRLLDGYPYRCPTKGGFTWARWRTVIITSNYPPEQWYSSTAEQSNGDVVDGYSGGARRDPAVLGEALLRRISEIIHME